jgi:hypothetical protein
MKWLADRALGVITLALLALSTTLQATFRAQIENATAIMSYTPLLLQMLSVTTISGIYFALKFSARIPKIRVAA